MENESCQGGTYFIAKTMHMFQYYFIAISHAWGQITIFHKDKAFE